MNLLDISAILALIFLLMLLIERATKKINIPMNVFLVLAGFVGSEVALLFVDDLGIRWHHIRDIILYLLIPIILFQTIFKLDFRLDKKDLLITLALALPLSLLTGVSLGFMLYWLIGNPEYFPLHSALVAGMLLASTSPTAMGILLKASNAPTRLNTIMMGEGLFNGLIAIMLFFFLIPLDNLDMSKFSSLVMISQELLYHLVLSISAGLFIAWLLIQLMKITESGFRHLIITQVGCFLSYYLASTVLNISGVASLLPTALMFLYFSQKNDDSTTHQFTQKAWDYKRYLASGSLHILMGVSLTFVLFTQQWLAMLIGIFSALFIRALIVFFVIPSARKILSAHPLDRAYCPVLWWGGMRGGTTIALALSLPETLTGWWTIQAIAYGAVLFSLSFQAGLLPRFIHKANRRVKQV